MSLTPDFSKITKAERIEEIVLIPVWLLKRSGRD
jgi:hypothetical protein